MLNNYIMKILNLFVIFLMLFIFNGCGGSDFTKNKVKYELWDNSRKTSSHVDKKESTFFKETYVSGESSYITLNDTSKLKVGVTVVVVDPYEKKTLL